MGRVQRTALRVALQIRWAIRLFTAFFGSPERYSFGKREPILSPICPCFFGALCNLASKHFFPVTAAPLLSDYTLRSGARHGRQARVEAANTPAAGRPFYWRRGRAGSSRQLCSAFVRLVAFC